MVHASSFTKTVCPGVRVGLPDRAEAGHRRDRHARATNLYISPGMVAERDRLPVLRSAGASTARSPRSAERWASAPGVLAESLRKHLPGASFTEPDGGYFLWVELPDDVDVGEGHDRGARAGVSPW